VAFGVILLIFMPDGFPVDGGDQDFRVQVLISRDLENARQLHAA
jgi:hypothetical protein